MGITELRTGEEDAWDSYVYESDASTFYHQIGWRNVVLKTYGHKPRYLVARGDDGGIARVLPMFLMESRVFGRKLVSVPFAPYGGVCADDAGVGRALVEEGVRVDYFEIRSLSNDGRYREGLVTNDTYFTLVMRVERDPELVWQGFSRKVRNATRKAMKSGLEVVKDGDYLRDFYRIYARNMRDLGAPVHAYSFYANLQGEFPEQTGIAVVRCDGRVIAGIFLLYFRDTIISGWASSDRSYQRFNPNNLLYWDVIKGSCEDGYFTVKLSVCQSPPWTSNWNKVKHEMFYHITQNWHEKPLISHEVIVNLIGNTTTRKGLKIRAGLDENEYQSGVKILDKEMAEGDIEIDDFHGEWN